MTWRNQLPQLEGWPLLPCGAGEKGKAPIDPATGHIAYQTGRQWPSRLNKSLA